jgi:hypothetical protein
VWQSIGQKALVQAISHNTPRPKKWSRRRGK